MFEKLFGFFGIDKNHFLALVKISLKTDFRPHTAPSSTRRRLISPAIAPFVIYGWLGFFLAVTLATKHASVQVYSFFMISYTMVMVFFAVLHEFDLILINPDDADIISFRPVNSVTYSAARLANFMIYVFLLTLSLSFMPAVVSLFLPEAGWLFPLLLLKITGIASLSTGFVVVIFYTELLNRVSANKLKDTITYMQVLFTLIIFTVYQLIPRLSADTLNADVSGAAKLLFLFPSAWYAGFIDYCTGSSGSFPDIFALLAVLFTLAVLIPGIRQFSLKGAAKMAFLLQQSEKVSTAGKEDEHLRTSIGPAALKFILRSNESQAGFFFALKMIKRDRGVRAGFLSIGAILVASVLLSFFDGSMADPFSSGSAVQTGNFSYVFMFSIFVIFAFVNFLQFSSDWEGSWIFKTLPMHYPGELYRGAKWVIVVHVLIPLYFIMFLAYSLKMGLFHAFLQIIVFFTFGVLALTCGFFLVNELPFSRKRVRGERVRTFKMIFYTLPIIVLYSILKNIIYADIINLFIVVILLFMISFFLEKKAIKRLNKILNN